MYVCTWLLLRTRRNRWFRINQVRFIVEDWIVAIFCFQLSLPAALNLFVRSLYLFLFHHYVVPNEDWRWTWMVETGFHANLVIISNRRHNSIHITIYIVSRGMWLEVHCCYYFSLVFSCNFFFKSLFVFNFHSLWDFYYCAGLLEVFAPFNYTIHINKIYAAQLALFPIN